MLLPPGYAGAADEKDYVGRNPDNPQFERGMPFPPLDLFGDLLSKIYQLLLWNRKYGNHRISRETEEKLAAFVSEYQLKDVKVRINQWAPHKEIGRLITNNNIAWPYKILFFPSTLITSIIARPFSGFLISDYYDPASNTIHIFSDDPAIALHEAGHAKDFADQKYKGTYGLARIIPGVNLVQESLATDEAFYYFEKHELYEDYIRAHKVLYPAYATYLISYLPASVFSLVGGLTIGHWYGHLSAGDAEASLRAEGKWPPKERKDLAENSNQGRSEEPIRN